MRTRATRLIAATLWLGGACGPKGGPEGPAQKGFVVVEPPGVSFGENLDIELDVPDDPGKLPLAEAVFRLPAGTVLGQAGHLVAIVDEREGTVIAVDVRDGHEVWKASIPQCPFCAFRLTPAFDGKRLVVSSGDVLVGLDAADGARLWEIEVQGLPDGEAILIGDSVLGVRTLERRPGPVCGSVTTRIVFVDTATGIVLWRIEYVGLYASFAVVRGYLHAVVSPGCDPGEDGNEAGYCMRVTRLADRKEMGKGDAPEPFGPLVVAGDTVVVQGPGSMAGYPAGSVTPSWTSPLEASVQSVVGSGDLLLVASQGSLRSVDHASGNVLWSRDLGDVQFVQGMNVTPTLTASEDIVLVPSAPDPLRGYLVVLDPGSGKVRRFFLGFEAISQALLWGGIGVLLTPEAVVALDLVQEGTPERDLVPPKAAARLLVDELADLVPFVPWEAASLEVQRLGPEALDALADMANEGSAVAGLLLARWLEAMPDPGGPGLLAGLVEMAVPQDDDPWASVHQRMVWEAIKALGASDSDDAVGVLDRVIVDDDLDPLLRSTAYASLGRLAAGGHEQATLSMDAWRKERMARTAAGWRLCPSPGSGFGRQGPFLVPEAGCKPDSDTPFAVSESVASPDGQWLAYTSPALGGRNDVWLVRFHEDEVQGPWFTGITVAGEIELQFLEKNGDGDLVLESVERECLGCYVDPSDAPDTGKPTETVLDLGLLARDADKDGLGDLVESRLGTSAKAKDTDQDGLADAKDPAPLGKPVGSAAADTRAEALMEAFFALVGFGESAEPLFVVGPPAVGLQYAGYTSVVLGVTQERAGELQRALGLPGPAMLTFGCPLSGNAEDAAGCTQPGEGGLGFVELDEAGQSASFTMTLYRSDADAAMYEVDLARVGGRWVVTSLALVVFS